MFMTDFCVNKLLIETARQGASDLHITVGVAPLMRLKGKLVRLCAPKVIPTDAEFIVKQLLSEEQLRIVDAKGQLDTSYSIAEVGRFRLNVYKQRGSYAVAIRLIPREIPTLGELKLPSILKSLALKKRGLVLVTGPTGSGKSTTLAAMINHINKEENKHIITLEDPIEYLHVHKSSVVNQREVGVDTDTFGQGLKACLRQDPDIILVGEMRDLDTVGIAITAGETGHLVLSTLHTIGATKTIDRVIDVFPPHQQQQIRVQLAAVLVGVVSQQLIPTLDGKGRVVALEIMVVTHAISNLIREGKTHQIQSNLQMGKSLGMVTMDTSLLTLYRGGKISRESLLSYAVDRALVEKELGL